MGCEEKASRVILAQQTRHTCNSIVEGAIKKADLMCPSPVQMGDML
jgi:hypothetical protein